MGVSVAVVDSLPIFQQGVASVLVAAGHTVDTPDDVVAWADRAQRTVVLLTLESERDWELLERLRLPTSTPAVIALLAEESAVLGVRAVRAGARSVVLRRVTVAVLRRTVEATIDGQAVLPAAVAAALAVGGSITVEEESNPLSAEQGSWLQQLAAGARVAQLAARVGYSERAMYRLLRALYRQIGVQNRVDAILWAQRRGLLTDESNR